MGGKWSSNRTSTTLPRTDTTAPRFTGAASAVMAIAAEESRIPSGTRPVSLVVGARGLFPGRLGDQLLLRPRPIVPIKSVDLSAGYEFFVGSLGDELMRNGVRVDTLRDDDRRKPIRAMLVNGLTERVL